MGVGDRDLPQVTAWSCGRGDITQGKGWCELGHPSQGEGH